MQRRRTRWNDSGRRNDGSRWTAATRPRLPLRTLVAAALIMATVAAAPRIARATQVDEYKRDRVVDLLSTEPFRPTLEDWKRVGSEANRILVELAEEPELRPSLQLRAMASLAWFPSRRSRAFLNGRLYGRYSSAVERRVAMRALALAFGLDAYNDLREFLTHEDPGVREGAVRALGLIRGRRVETLLRHHLAAEKSFRVRHVIEEVLAELRRAGPRKRPRVEPGAARLPAPRHVPVDDE